MADVTRAFDFSALAPGSKIKGADVDAEFDVLFAGHNAQEDALEALLAPYRLVSQAAGRCVSPAPGTDYYFTPDGNLASDTTAHTLDGLETFYLVAADHAVAGRSTRLRLRAQAYSNAVASTVAITAGLFPITASLGAGSTLGISTGAVVAGSTVALGAVAVNSMSQGNSGDFAVPADGFYALGLAFGAGTWATGARVAMNLQLQAHNIV